MGAAANASMDVQNNVKEKKKAKKRKLEKENGAEAKIDWAQEVDQVLPLNGDSAEKKKKEKEASSNSAEEEAEEVEEKGAFKKIFYKPTKATLAVPKEDVDAFQEVTKCAADGVTSADWMLTK